MTDAFDEIIRSAVISSRTLLRNGRSPDDVIPLMLEAVGCIDDIPLLPTQIILRAWLPEAIRAAERGNIDRAVAVLNFLHNLPLTPQERERWSLDYFLVIELPTFLDTFGLNEVPTVDMLQTLDAIVTLGLPEGGGA
ncbi:hypothetical protein BJI69_19830 [Luteibacter rhizovicinus DSM 16549]|uniref:Uncharacterized protein n=1 Tax=Luteibacter rhizovicinus DSM 16549 TaxID=1440763 RepID=A0A0G9HCC7_9GAMM|nr:hypothetical protein [Luteibacter rhizovicinus]APG05930.1 hypothetical protein BJI69_19830 [Luteibacter rhizovicinus DSM 16549]KLD67121.1 hypothetical protein Y883_09165 [Luteibacter rhizovicinus DSM 16549]